MSSTETKPKQYYWFTMVLYPDNCRHLDFVQKVLPNLPLRVIGIEHDSDSIHDDVELLKIFMTPEQKDNFDIVAYDSKVIKKSHLHLILKLPIKRTLQGMRDIIESYRVEGRFIRPCEPFHMMSYLTHRCCPEKHQYSEDDIFGDIDLYRQYTSYSHQDDFLKFFEALTNYKNACASNNAGVSYCDCVYYMHNCGLGHLLKSSGNYMYNNMINETLKEIKQYGLHYTIPYYGKV